MLDYTKCTNFISTELQLSVLAKIIGLIAFNVATDIPITYSANKSNRNLVFLNVAIEIYISFTGWRLKCLVLGLGYKFQNFHDFEPLGRAK